MLQPSSFPSIVETLEMLIGVCVSEVVRQDDHIGQHNVVNEEEKSRTTVYATKPSSCVDTHYVQSETSVKIAMEIVAEILPGSREGINHPLGYEK